MTLRRARPLADGVETETAVAEPDGGDSTRLPLTLDEAFVHGALPLDRYFPGGAPIEVEFGTGKGRFLIESARLHPGRRFLGLERSLAYYRIARDRIARAALSNAQVIRADAAEAIALLPDGSIDAFHAYFLDPWPKKKQRKRRLLTAPFLAAAASKTGAGGSFRMVTDHADYGDAITDAIERIIAEGSPWILAPWESLQEPPPTHYELKYRAAGRTFQRFLLIRR